MPQYTFRIDPAGEGEAEIRTETLENDEVAVHVGRRLLDARRAAVRVGRGVGDSVQWIGLWAAGGRHVAWSEQV